MDIRTRHWRIGAIGGFLLAILPTVAMAAEKREAWDAVFIAGKKVGYIHTAVEPVQAGDGRELLRVQVQTQLRFKRLEDTVTLQTRYGTIETPSGTVLRLDSRSKAGPTELRISGDVADAKMNLTLEGGGQTQRVQLDWPEDVRGPYGPEMSLSREPLSPGQSRVVKTFIPDLNKVGETRMEARAMENVELGGGASMELLRIDSVVNGPDGKPIPGMATTYWADPSGQILKSETDVFGGLTIYRTTREAALAPIQSPLDLVRASIVPVGRKINQPASTRYALYQIRYNDGDPNTVFPADRRQSVRRGEGDALLLEVRTMGPNEGASETSAVDPEMLAANPLINSADPTVMKLTAQAIGGATDPWSKAQAITNWVSSNVREKNFEVSFATAKDVARDLTGDCSEHSVLTAAMCRAAGIPCRVVVGLVYADRLEGFGFHMWNEVYVQDRWVAIDSTFGQTDVDATHLKLNDSSLAGVSPYESFLDVAKVFSRLRMDPLEVR